MVQLKLLYNMDLRSLIRSFYIYFICLIFAKNYWLNIFKDQSESIMAFLWLHENFPMKHIKNLTEKESQLCKCLMFIIQFC